MTKAPAKTKFLPSYVGSKAHWISSLQSLAGRPFAEMFAGSAVLSANLASKALLVEYDPVVAKILARFPDQMVPEVFTRENYYDVRGRDDWWLWTFALQAMSFSGIFRYSENGFNVPAKGGEDNTGKNKKGEKTITYPNEYRLRPLFERTLNRWNELQPDIRACSYIDVPLDDVAELGDDAVLVLDPPYATKNKDAKFYESGKQGDFDHAEFWDYARAASERFDVLVFERERNLVANGFNVSATRKMRVNGSRPGDVEAMSFIKRKVADLIYITIITAIMKAIFA
jgi:site-specific DNA-adenine methylase